MSRPANRNVATYEGPIHAAAYNRCSSRKQAEKDSSMPAQRGEIERRAKQDGATVVRWFEDGGISGKNVEDRPGMTELLDYVDEQKTSRSITRLYVYDGKRIARNRTEMFAIRAALKRAGIEFVALVQPSVEDAAANAILEGVWDGIAEAERIQLAKVVRRGQRQALLQGLWPYNKVPYGYDRVEEKNAHDIIRWKLVLDPAEAEVVKHIFELYIGGRGSKGIAGLLQAERVPSPARGDLDKRLVTGWVQKHVRTIVTSVAVYGAVEWEGKVVNEAHHAAIVSKETFEQAQRLATARCRTSSTLGSLNTAKSDHGLFRPYLRCGSCGGKMYMNRGGTPTNRLWYFACSTRVRSTASCIGMTVPAAELDEALLTTLERDILTPERVRTIISETLARMTEDAGGEVRERRAALEARLKDLSGSLARLGAAISAGTMDMEDVGALSAPLRQQRDEARAELARLPEPQPVPTIEQVNPEKFRQRLLALWRDADITVRRHALDQIIEDVRLEAGVAILRYSWKAEPDTHTYQVPSGPPNAPMPFRVPSTSLYPAAGLSMSMAGERESSVKSSTSGSLNRGSDVRLSSPSPPQPPRRRRAGSRPCRRG